MLSANTSTLFARGTGTVSVPLRGVSFNVLSRTRCSRTGNVRCFFGEGERTGFCLRGSYTRGYCTCRRNRFQCVNVPGSLLATCRSELVCTSNSTTLYSNMCTITRGQGGQRGVNRQRRVCRGGGNNFLPSGFSRRRDLILRARGKLIVFDSYSRTNTTSVVQRISRAFPRGGIFSLVNNFRLFGGASRRVLELTRRVERASVRSICANRYANSHTFTLLGKGLKSVTRRLGIKLSVRFWGEGASICLFPSCTSIFVLPSYTATPIR